MTIRLPLPSLRALLAVLLAASTFVGALVAYGLASNMRRRELTEDARAHVASLARDLAARFEVSLAEHRRGLEIAIQSVDVREATQNPIAARLFLRRLQEVTPHYAIVGFVDPTGRVLLTSNGLAEGADVSERAYFKAGMEGTYVSDAHDAILLAKALGSADSMPRIVDIAMPVRTEGRVVGVIAAQLAVAWATEVGAQVASRLENMYPGAAVTLRGADGGVIYASSQHIAESDRGELESRAPVGGVGENGRLAWTVTVAAPRRDEPMATRDVLVLGAGLSIITVLTGAIGWLIGRRMTEPLDHLTEDIVAGGALGSRTQRMAFREADDLSVAMRMFAGTRGKIGQDGAD